MKLLGWIFEFRCYKEIPRRKYTDETAEYCKHGTLWDHCQYCFILPASERPVTLAPWPDDPPPTIVYKGTQEEFHFIEPEIDVDWPKEKPEGPPIEVFTESLRQFQSVGRGSRIPSTSFVDYAKLILDKEKRQS